MPEPNNLLLPEHGIVFMFICKAANTSMKMALLSALGAGTNEEMVNHRIIVAKSAGAVRVVDKAFCRRSPGLLKVSVVRHPFDRVLSLYHNKVAPDRTQSVYRPFVVEGVEFGCTLDAFVQHVCGRPDKIANQHYRSQTWDIADDAGLIPDYVGRFESLPTAWRHIQFLCGERGLALPALPHTNTTPKHQQFSKEQLRRLGARYTQDLDLLGYSGELYMAV